MITFSPFGLPVVPELNGSIKSWVPSPGEGREVPGLAKPHSPARLSSSGPHCPASASTTSNCGAIFVRFPSKL